MQITEEKVYWERQEIDLLCAVHAINSLLQYPCWEIVALATIAQSFDDEEQNLVNNYSMKGNNVEDSGNFSIQAISKALNLQDFNVEYFNPKKDPRIEEGFICNYSAHWISLRKIKENWYNLNSLALRPELISELYLLEYINQIMNEGYSIFVVTGPFLTEEYTGPLSENQYLIPASAIKNKSFRVKASNPIIEYDIQKENYYLINHPEIKDNYFVEKNGYDPNKIPENSIHESSNKNKLLKIAEDYHIPKVVQDSFPEIASKSAYVSEKASSILNHDIIKTVKSYIPESIKSIKSSLNFKEKDHQRDDDEFNAAIQLSLLDQRTYENDLENAIKASQEFKQKYNHDSDSDMNEAIRVSMISEKQENSPQILISEYHDPKNFLLNIKSSQGNIESKEFTDETLLGEVIAWTYSFEPLENFQLIQESTRKVYNQYYQTLRELELGQNIVLTIERID